MTEKSFLFLTQQEELFLKRQLFFASSLGIEDERNSVSMLPEQRLIDGRLTEAEDSMSFIQSISETLH